MKYFLRHSGSTYFEEKEFNAIYKILQKRINTLWPKKVILKMRKDLKQLIKYVKSLDAKKINRQQLEKFFELLHYACQSIYFTVFMAWIIEEEVGKLTLNFSAKKRDLILRLCRSFYSPVQAQYIQALKQFKKSDSELEIKKIIKRFGWIKNYLMNVKELTVEDIKEDLKSLDKKLKEKAKFPRIQLNSKLKRLVSLGQLYSQFRDWRLFELNKVFYYTKPFFESYFKNTGLNYEQLIQLRVAEFLNKKFDKKAIIKRQKDHGVIMQNGKITVITGKELAKIKKETDSQISQQKEIVGKVAMTGKVRGRVRIVLPYNFHQLKKGEIVVTSETTPEAVSYIRNVKAIITDEGGITSHAAIIFRELGIPCVIGTKIVTKVLKDGDKVEVDANKGMVKVIKNN
ncbi:hypothetical protein KKF32_02090 [Patescibacteria group bacterium]|nr:hypothetical protein [Patescibacteria group bacterium]